MSLNSWSKRWLLTTLGLLIIIVLSILVLSMILLQDRNSGESNLSLNQVRLKVNPILLALEQNYQHLNEQNIREDIRSTARETGVRLTYLNLDGKVILSSDPTSEGTQVNLRTALHYDLHHATQAADGNDLLDIAFPVMDGPTGSQIGNAIFSIPQAMVTVQQSMTFPVILISALMLLSLILSLFLFWMKRKLDKHLLSPIHQLKQHAESMLKGNYEEKIQYNRNDELLEVYAMFDLMRTEIKHMSEQRIQQEQAQKELITNISHDIKTPITTIKAYIEAIEEGLCNDQETLMEYMGVMRTHTDKTARLVEDLLVHALQELGQISVETRELYSGPILETMLKPIEHVVLTKGLIYKGPNCIPNVLIAIDPTRIEQVISNLAANALKHTAPGDTIRIDMELESEHLNVTIADSGQGIRVQDMPFVFQRYFRGQASHAEQRVQEGTGLGLSICQSIIEAHGGHISFTSKEGQGTTFRFYLPIC
ncbi:signal transduction histidine kinase [Paenibacillus xylanexedens]|uniref:sensor histidine kinase n=1 Tax=Paenibacillus xylanexedens TaxID=528191 RepID=UPI00209D4D4D|nr:ATP-binding protein [Paenibacillus xylanexedens]MCP1423174.1 signal transduction histidine kinase [Paenibacillus xylanexedens]